MSQLVLFQVGRANGEDWCRVPPFQQLQQTCPVYSMLPPVHRRLEDNGTPRWVLKLKLAVSRDLLAFFIESKPLEPLINRLKCFSGVIRILSSKNSTPRSVSQGRLQLCAVLVNFVFQQTKFFDSVQCQSQRGHLFRKNLRENNFSAEVCLSGTQVGWNHGEKNANKSCGTATLGKTINRDILQHTKNNFQFQFHFQARKKLFPTHPRYTCSFKAK